MTEQSSGLEGRAATTMHAQEVEHDDDTPLTFLRSPSGGHNTAVRRSQTITAAGSRSRLYRITSGASSPGAGGAAPSPPQSSSAHGLSASMGVSRRASVKSPTLNRVLEGDGEPERDTANASYQEDASEQDHGEIPLYGSAFGLSRHSSMPLSRAFRTSNNPGAPWQRAALLHSDASPASGSSSNPYDGHTNPHAHAVQAHTASSLEQRLRSNSTAAEKRLSGVMSTSPLSGDSDSVQGYPGSTTSPAGRPYSNSATTTRDQFLANAPSSPINSGFVVTSRPLSGSMSGSAAAAAAIGLPRNAVGHPSAGVVAHGRSLSSHGRPGSASDGFKNASPSHSRRPSDATAGTSLHNPLHSPYNAQLGRAPSNASTTGGHSHHSGSGGSGSAGGRASPTPASPIDGSLLGQNNPWSPTATERKHFRELSGSLNLAALRTQPHSAAPSGETTHLQWPEASSPSPTGRGVQDSALRRASSLNMHSNALRRAPVDDVRPMRQPQRRNTPSLPPLVTSTDALYTAALQNSTTTAQHAVAAQTAHPNVNVAENQQDVDYSSAYDARNHGAAVAPSNAPAPNILRGPVSAAPYVPPIGHTHVDGRPAFNRSLSQQAQQELRNSQAGYQQQQAPPAAMQPLRDISRGVTTAGPGITEGSYLRDKERLAGIQHGHSQSLSHIMPQNNTSPPNVPPQAAFLASALSPTHLQSASAMQFPTLNSSASAAAFSNNLQLQQQLLAQQTQQLQEQQAHLAAALAAGLTLHDSPGQANSYGQQQNGALSGLVGSPHSLPTANDPYVIAAKIDALQKANAMLASAVSGPYPPQAQMQQPQSLHRQHHSLSQSLSPALGGSFAPSPQLGSMHHATPPGSTIIDQVPGFPAFPVNAQQQHQQQANGISPIDIHALAAAKGYNPRDFDVHPALARFFVIKSFTEDDVFKSIKFEIWSSTVLGNNRLDKAFAESADRGPIYLFFSVNASGHFCGIAEMLTPLDYTVTSNVWAQGDKWKGVMKLRWIYIKDIPNPALRHLKLTNTSEQKPVTSSRDTQEVPYEQGCEMLRIFNTYQSRTTLLQDFAYYQAQTHAQGNGPAETPQNSQMPFNGIKANGHSPFQVQPSSRDHQAPPSAFANAGVTNTRPSEVPYATGQPRQHGLPRR